jgi:uncharacterized protein YegP (UPF0339 family)
MAKNKPGIHLVKRKVYIEEAQKHKTWYWWKIVSKNGRIIARSSEAYTRKSGAVKSIRIVARTFYEQTLPKGKPMYYDHSKKDSPLISYL